MTGLEILYEKTELMNNEFKEAPHYLVLDKSVKENHQNWELEKSMTKIYNSRRKESLLCIFT